MGVHSTRLWAFNGGCIHYESLESRHSPKLLTTRRLKPASLQISVTGKGFKQSEICVFIRWPQIIIEINIVTVRMAPPSVNVDKVLEIGKRTFRK